MLNACLAAILALASGSTARFITASGGNHHPCGSMHAFQLVKNPRLLSKLAIVRARCLRLHAAAKAFNAPCGACSASAVTGTGPCKTPSMGRGADGRQIVFCRGFQAATLHHKAFRLLGGGAQVVASVEGAVVGVCPRGYQPCADRAPHTLSYEVQHTVYLESDYDREGRLRNTTRAGLNVAHWASPPAGGTPRLFISRPTLPQGMQLNKRTGAITGAPRCADCNGRSGHPPQGRLSKHRMYFYQIFALNNGGAAKARISVLIGATETTRAPTLSPTPKPTPVPTPEPPSTTTALLTTAVVKPRAAAAANAVVPTTSNIGTTTKTTIAPAASISASMHKTLLSSSMPAAAPAPVPAPAPALMRSNAPLASRTVDDLNWAEAQGHLALQAEARRFVDDGASGGVCFTSALPGRFLPGCSLSCASFARLDDAMRVCLKVARKAAALGKVGCGGIVRERHGHTPYQLRVGRPTARAQAASAAAISAKAKAGKRAQLAAEARGVIPAVPAPLNLTLHSGFDENSFALGPCVDARYGRKQLLRGRRRFERQGFGAKRALWRPILHGDANEAQGGVLALSAHAVTRAQAGVGGHAGVGFSLYGWFKLPRLAMKQGTATGAARLRDTHGEALGGCLACFTTVSTRSNVTTSAKPPPGAACLVIGHDAVLRYTIAGQGTVLEWAPRGGASLADGLWHFVAVVRAARTGTLRLFCDGRPVLARQHPNAVHVRRQRGSKAAADDIMAWRVVLGAGNQHWPMQSHSAFRGELAEWYYWGLGVDTFMLGDEFKHTAMAAQSAPGPAPTAAPTSSPTQRPTPPPTYNGNAAAPSSSVRKAGWRPARFSGSPFLGLLQLRKLRRVRQGNRAALVRKANACGNARCVNALAMPVRQCVYSSPRRGAYLSGCPKKVAGGCGGYSSLDDARDLCDVTADCGGVTREPGAGRNAFQLRRGSRFIANAAAFDAFAAHEISYRRIGCGMVLPSRDCPLITVLGARVVSVPAGARYVDPGVEAFDATDGLLRAPHLMNSTTTLDAECAILNVKQAAPGTVSGTLGGRYELQRLQHEAHAVYRQQRGQHRFVLYFSHRLQGWCFGSKPGGDTVTAFVRSLAHVPDQISPSNIWLVGRTGEVRVSDVGVSFKNLRLAPGLELACAVRGSLGYAHGLTPDSSQVEPGLAASASIVALGALPGTYTLKWHATNRRGQHECLSAQRTVIVRRVEARATNTNTTRT